MTDTRDLKCTFEDAEDQRRERDQSLTTEERIDWFEGMVAFLNEAGVLSARHDDVKLTVVED